MGHAIENVFEYYDYPFFYTMMKTDAGLADVTQRIYNELNIGAFPTAWWDGGYEVLVGGYTGLSYYTSRIESCAQRESARMELSIALEYLGNYEFRIDLMMVNLYFPNEAPSPVPPAGESEGCTGIEYEFSSVASDPEGHQVYYRFDFDDGTITDWLGPYTSGDTCMAPHIWNDTGTFNVKAQAKDEYEKTSAWSESHPILIHSYLAGDANGDLTVNLLDIVFNISFLYMDGPSPDPYASGDANGNGVVNILDIVYQIDYLYQGGPAPVYQ
jgi:hypothetical protein